MRYLVAASRNESSSQLDQAALDMASIGTPGLQEAPWMAGFDRIGASLAERMSQETGAESASQLDLAALDMTSIRTAAGIGERMGRAPAVAGRGMTMQASG